MSGRRWRGLVLVRFDTGWDAYRRRDCDGLTPRWPGNGCVVEDAPTLAACKAEALDVLRLERMIGEQVAW